MDRAIPRPGDKYISFKNKPYQIICLANDSLTREKIVVYQALFGGFECLTRPLPMFMEEVDREKYPNAQQNYCFEPADEKKENAPDDLNAKSLEFNPHQIDVVDLDEADGTPEEPAEAADGFSEASAESADPVLLQFLDADTLEQKYQLLKSLHCSITDRLVDDFAVAMDLVIPEGDLEYRYQQLLSSVRTMQKFETTRFRR